MDWDSNLTEEDAAQSGNNFELLPDGDYAFEVKKLEKSSYTATPNARIPSCPMAIVHLQASTPDGSKTNYFRERLYLYDGNKWRLLQFFTCLGLRKHGDGKSTKDGNDYQTVTKWLDPVDAAGAEGEEEVDW